MAIAIHFASSNLLYLYLMKNFSKVYNDYHSRLLRFACDYVLCKEDAENLLHDMFLDLWNKREVLNDVKNLNAYLFCLVRNRCLDYVKHKMYERQYAERTMDDYRLGIGALESISSDSNLMTAELIGVIKSAIAALPERCRQIFLMSRVEELRHKEIAEKLGIAENTVSVQIGIALNRVRTTINLYIKDR